MAESVGNAIGLGGAVLTAWNILKWPVILLLVILVIAILYYATPNVKQPKFRWMSLGPGIALVINLQASLAFAFYVANFNNYDKTYGAIGGLIVSLLWLWILNMSLLFGAEFDAEMERGRQLQAGIEAEETIQLPPAIPSRAISSRHAKRTTFNAAVNNENNSATPMKNRRTTWALHPEAPAKLTAPKS